MPKLLLCFVFALGTLGAASAAMAGELSVKIANGRATVIAKDVPVRQILAEWARVGETKVVNAEKIPGGPISLELVDVPEKEALDVLLRTAAGYIAAPRPGNITGASQFDRVIVLATSRPPAATASVAPSYGRPAIPQMPPQMPPQPPPDDDDGEPGDQGPMPPPVLGPNGPVQTFPGVNGTVMGPNGPVNVPMGPNGMPMGPNANPNQPPTTAPRPGQLPTAQPQMPNPYAPPTRPGQMPVRPGGEGE